MLLFYKHAQILGIFAIFNWVKMQLVYKPLGELIPYVNNSRTHSDLQITQIAGSIREFGFTNPVLIDENNNVIAGHGRIAAAKLLKMTDLPCIVLSGLSDMKRKALVIADNQLATNAGWDLDLLKLELSALDESDFNLDILGFDEEFLKSLEAQEPVQGLTDDDDVPEVAENIHGVKSGDIWQLGNHRLMCGDSTSKEQVEKLMNGEKADLWVTDPPYGVDIKKVTKERYENTGRGNSQSSKQEISNDKIEDKESWMDFLKKVFLNAYFFTDEKASHYVFSCQGSDKQMMMMMMQEVGWNIRHEIIWMKNRFILGRSDYHYQHEPCLYGWKEKGSHNWYGNRDKSSVLQYDVSKNDLHPTMKPIGLMEEIIKNSSKLKDIILETFCGFGSTLIACEKTNRKCYGMEIDPHYCSVVIERWQNFTGKKAERLNGES